MNREIKFRAWDAAFKVMLDSSYGNWISFDGIAYEEASRKHNTPNIEIEQSRRMFLMQYTGLKDKNGKEIYEGDVVKQTGNEKMFGEVVFDKSDSAFRHIHRGISNKDFNTGEMCPLHSVEIIGNIYENPDLLQ